LTQPGVAQSVVLTRLAGRTGASMPARESVSRFATHGTTMAVFLSAARPEELAAELLAPGSGYRAATPAAIVIRASWPDETVIRTTVGALAQDLRATGTTMTVLVLVGDALDDGQVARRSHLYAPGYGTAYRLRSQAGSTAGRPSARRR
jgi:precorrin-4/cobalt-precorrin-4 C11-methyltransferase